MRGRLSSLIRGPEKSSDLAPRLLPETMAEHWWIYEGVQKHGFDRGKGIILAETVRIIPEFERDSRRSDNVYWHFCDEGVPVNLSTIFGWDTSIDGGLAVGSPNDAPALRQQLRLTFKDLQERTSPKQMAERAVQADEWLSGIGLAGLDLSKPDEAARLAEEGQAKFEEAGFGQRIPA